MARGNKIYREIYEWMQYMLENKNQTKVPAEKLITNEIQEKLWIYLIVDFITKLLLVARKNMILVVCNRLFKMAYFVAIAEEILVERLTRLSKDNI